MQTPDDRRFWIAVKTFYAQEGKVSRYLDQHQTQHFIPMMTHTVMDQDGKVRHRKQPAVHNLIFIPVGENRDGIQKILKDCPYTNYVYRRVDHPEEWCLIPDHDMMDLRLMCDNSLNRPLLLSTRECEMKVGHAVRIVHGTMTGLCGKLIRKNKKYYILKSFEGFGMAVVVSRWCCVPDENADNIRNNTITE